MACAGPTQVRHCPRSSQPLSPALGDIPTLGSREEGCEEWMGLRPGAKLPTPVEPAPLSPGISLSKAGRARSSQKDAECSGKQELPTLSLPYSPSGRSGMGQILKTKSRVAQQLSSSTGFEIHGLKRGVHLLKESWRCRMCCIHPGCADFGDWQEGQHFPIAFCSHLSSAWRAATSPQGL